MCSASSMLTSPTPRMTLMKAMPACTCPLLEKFKLAATASASAPSPSAVKLLLAYFDLTHATFTSNVASGFGLLEVASG